MCSVSGFAIQRRKIASYYMWAYFPRVLFSRTYAKVAMIECV